MYLIRERIQRFTCRSDSVIVFARLVSKLRELNLPIIAIDEEKKEVAVRCLRLFANWILWRCWSDKLLFKISQGEAGKAVVEVFALPTLTRFAQGGEQVTDLRDLLSRLAIGDL